MFIMTNLTIINAEIYTPIHRIDNGYVVIENGVIKKIGSGRPSRIVGELLDAENNIVAPGFIDTHTHGYNGVDASYSDKNDLFKWTREVVRHGVTAIIPSTVTLPHKDTIRACKNIRDAMGEWSPRKGARILGVHLEGPYISKEKRGAQNPEYIREFSIEEMREYIAVSSNNIRQITVAPEVRGVIENIPFLVQNNIIVSLGHSNADYATAERAILMGATKATHLYNAMSSIHHRKPGIVIALLRNRNVNLELIADLIHVAPEMIMFTFEYAGPYRVVLVTDSISATMLPDGEYELGGLKIEVRDSIARIAGTNTLAGSTLTMDRAVKNLVKIGLPLQDALIASTYTPAMSVHALHREHIGLIAPGYRGDIVILSRKNLDVKYTIIEGIPVHSSEG